MNDQSRTTATAATQDAWDRLAALAFGDTASAGGCSVHAHDCACLAEEHASVEHAEDGAELLTGEAAAPGVPTAPESERPSADARADGEVMPPWTPEPERSQ